MELEIPPEVQTTLLAMQGIVENMMRERPMNTLSENEATEITTIKKSMESASFSVEMDNKSDLGSFELITADEVEMSDISDRTWTLVEAEIGDMQDLNESKFHGLGKLLQKLTGFAQSLVETQGVLVVTEKELEGMIIPGNRILEPALKLVIGALRDLMSARRDVIATIQESTEKFKQFGSAQASATSESLGPRIPLSESLADRKRDDDVNKAHAIRVDLARQNQWMKDASAELRGQSTKIQDASVKNGRAYAKYAEALAIFMDTVKSVKEEQSEQKRLLLLKYPYLERMLEDETMDLDNEYAILDEDD